MPRLIHLNGPPGIGKSTLARRYVEDHQGVLNCDIDLLRTLVGGWDRDFAGTGGLIRPAALALIGAYLQNGHDVVLPQLIVRLSELERFELAGRQAGATFVEIALMDDRAAAVGRFLRRGLGPEDPWNARVSRVVEADVGAQQLGVDYDALLEMLTDRPDAHLIASVEGDPGATYQSLLAALLI